MILVDANLLIYAYNESAEQHHAAKRWLEDVICGDEPVRLSWSGIQAFLRLTTERTLQSRALPMAEAVAIVESWLAQENVGVLDTGTRHWPLFRKLLLESQIRSAMVTDAHLAALAIEHGATLCTTDKDFTRFEGLRLVNPLQQKR